MGTALGHRSQLSQLLRYITPQWEPISVVARIPPHCRCSRSRSSGSSPSSAAWVVRVRYAPWKSGQPLKNVNVPDNRRRMICNNIYQTFACVRLELSAMKRFPISRSILIILRFHSVQSVVILAEVFLVSFCSHCVSILVKFVVSGVKLRAHPCFQREGVRVFFFFLRLYPSRSEKDINARLNR